MKIFRRLLATCAVTLCVTTASVAAPGTGQSQSNGFPIPFWYSLDAPSAHHLESMIESFEAEHSHLDIQPRNFASPEEMYRAIESGDEPMFAIIEGNQLKRLDETTDLTTVEDWMPRDQFLFSWSVKHDVYGRLFEGSSVDGRLMGRPFFYTTTALIYDMDILQKKGVSAPTTWAELDTAAEELTDESTGTWGFAFDDNDDVEETLDLMMHQSADSVADGGQADVLASVLQLGQDLAKTVGLPEDVRSGGHVAMRTGTVTDFFRLREQGYNVRTAGVPGPDASHRRTDFRVWSLGMFPVQPGDLYKAQEFAFWLMDFNQQRDWAENTPYLSAHVKVFDNPYYRQKRSEDHNSLRVFVNLLNRADMVAARNTYETSRMATLMSVFPKLIRGELDTQAALKMFASTQAEGLTGAAEEVPSATVAEPEASR